MPKYALQWLQCSWTSCPISLLIFFINASFTKLARFKMHIYTQCVKLNTNSVQDKKYTVNHKMSNWTFPSNTSKMSSRAPSHLYFHDRVCPSHCALISRASRSFGRVGVFVALHPCIMIKCKNQNSLMTLRAIKAITDSSTQEVEQSYHYHRIINLKLQYSRKHGYRGRQTVTSTK